MLTIATIESWLRGNVSFKGSQELNFTTTEWRDKPAMHERDLKLTLELTADVSLFRNYYVIAMK